MIVTIDHNHNADRLDRLDQNGEVKYRLYRTRHEDSWRSRKEREQKDDSWKLALVNGTILDYEKDVTLQKVWTFEDRKFRKKPDNKPKLSDFKRDSRFFKAKEREQAEDEVFVDELAGETYDGQSEDEDDIDLLFTDNESEDDEEGEDDEDEMETSPNI